MPEFNYLDIFLTKIVSLKKSSKGKTGEKKYSPEADLWHSREKLERRLKTRMMVFDFLVLGVMMYGIELLRWKESAEVKTIQPKYIIWTLDLDRCTTGYIIMTDTNKEKIRTGSSMKL